MAYEDLQNSLSRNFLLFHFSSNVDDGVCVCVWENGEHTLSSFFKKTVWGEKLRTLLALYICIYILFIYEERPHNVDLCNVFCLFVFSYGTLAAASSKKHRKSKSYLQYIYIYFFMYRGRSWYLFSRSTSTFRIHISYHEVKIDPKNLSKARAQGMGNEVMLSVVQSSARLLETGQDEPGGHLSVGR